MEEKMNSIFEFISGRCALPSQGDTQAVASGSFQPCVDHAMGKAVGSPPTTSQFPYAQSYDQDGSGHESMEVENPQPEVRPSSFCPPPPPLSQGGMLPLLATKGPRHQIKPVATVTGPPSGVKDLSGPGSSVQPGRQAKPSRGLVDYVIPRLPRPVLPTSSQVLASQTGTQRATSQECIQGITPLMNISGLGNPGAEIAPPRQANLAGPPGPTNLAGAFAPGQAGQQWDANQLRQMASYYTQLATEYDGGASSSLMDDSDHDSDDNSVQQTSSLPGGLKSRLELDYPTSTLFTDIRARMPGASEPQSEDKAWPLPLGV